MVEYLFNHFNQDVFLDTLLNVSDNICEDNGKKYIDFEKSFFYVYKSISSKNKINNHLKYKFTKYNFMLKNIKIIESQSYIKFLEKENL